MRSGLVKTVKQFDWSKKWLRLGVILLGVVILALGLLQGYFRYKNTHGSVLLPDPSQTITVDDSKPAEVRPGKENESSFRVPADQPRRVEINSLGINGLVQRVGTTASSAVGIPSNVHFAGWYVDAKTPGQPGLSIIDGHVSGNYVDGIFKHLGEARTGEIVKIEFGDGSVTSFKVREVRKLPLSEAPDFLFHKQPDIESQLNLITCGGNFDKASSSYDERVVVVTEKVSS